MSRFPPSVYRLAYLFVWDLNFSFIVSCKLNLHWRATKPLCRFELMVVQGVK